ncbi:Ras-related protein RABA5b [Halotydeus destructor]|nr:Ras-related protein RABA5b [Halotydeus destructor]
MIIDDIEVTLNIWDTVGQDHYRAVVGNYYRYADAALLVYDVNRRDTLDALDYWASELDLNCGNARVIKVLVGNKLDLVPPTGQLSVRLQLASRWAAERSISSVLQTSAMSGYNVSQAFEAAIRLTTKFQDVENDNQSSSSEDDPIIVLPSRPTSIDYCYGWC